MPQAFYFHLEGLTLSKIKLPDPKHANDHSGATASKTRMEYATPVSLLSWSTNGTLRFIESPSFQKRS
jgi:hypothetical protein